MILANIHAGKTPVLTTLHEAKNGVYKLRGNVFAKDERYWHKKLYIDEGKNGVYILREKVFAKDERYQDKKLYIEKAKNGIYKLREKVFAKDERYRDKKLYIDEAKNGVYKLRRNNDQALLFSLSRHNENQKEASLSNV